MMNDLTATALGDAGEMNQLSISCDKMLAREVIDTSCIRTNVIYLELERLQLLSWESWNDISTQDKIE